MRLRRSGRPREATDLLRQVALVERMDELHRHASNLETFVGLCRALAAFATEDASTVADPALLAQLGEVEPSAVHGTAYRETAALRNRAIGRIAATIARHERSR